MEASSASSTGSRTRGPTARAIPSSARSISCPRTALRDCSRRPPRSPKSAGAGSALSGLSFSLDDAAADVLWSPVVKGDTIGVEVSLPFADALSAFSFSIGKVSHIDGPIEATTFDPLRLNCTNHIDVQCAQGRFPATQADAVASILFDDDDGTFICSGTLLNDTLDDTLA